MPTLCVFPCEYLWQVSQVKVDINDLIIGMYVFALDRPWSQTPFPLQGFFIRQSDDIDQLRLYCKYVFIDVQRGKQPVAVKHATIDKRLVHLRICGRDSRFLLHPLN